jgi:hypothetical protein
MKNATPSIKLDRFKIRPLEPKQLFGTLQVIFPQFGQSDDNIPEEMAEAEGAGHGLHYVMHLFTEWFGANRGGISDRQYRALGHLLNAAVTVDDDLENAVSTCLLEHLRQINGYRAISPYLSKKAKQKTHA